MISLMIISPRMCRKSCQHSGDCCELFQRDIALHRKKRLADKKYEFTDDDEAKDKFVPLTRLRSKKLAEAEAAGWLNPLRNT